VILFIDDPHVRLRAAPYQGLYCAASAAGTQCMGIQVFDTLRGLDYLLTRSDVDPNRIGVAGLCQGSEQTWLAAALDDRFKIAALGVVGAITVRDWAEKVAPHQNEFRFWAPYFHEITMHTDLQFVYSSIAPRPLLLVDGTYRNFWPESGYRRVSEMADLIFGLYAKPDALTKLPAKSDWGIEEVRQWLGATLKYKQPAAN